MIKILTSDGKEFEKIEDAEKYEKELEEKKTTKEKDKKELEDALNKYLELKKAYYKKYNEVHSGVKVVEVEDFNDLINNIFDGLGW